MQKKFQLPIKQFVIYIGQEPLTMRAKLSEDEIFTGFELKNLSQLDYQTVLSSDIPEEIILTALCDFKQEEIQAVLQKIITRLQALSKDEITLQKYIRQIMTFGRLRNFNQYITQTLKDMAIVYDIEKDPLYKEGELRKTIRGIQRVLEKNKFTLEEIADLFEVGLDFVLKVQKGEIK